VAKIISKHCELVKLCHINLSGPVFLRRSVYGILKVKKFLKLLFERTSL